MRQRLRLLSLESNRFTGKLTCRFSEMTSLRVLVLGDNFLSGGLPQSLGTLTGLVSCDFSFNRLSGSIPFRPRTQTNLYQMNFVGNEDLIAPDRWLRHETLRFQLEKTRASPEKTVRPHTCVDRSQTLGLSRSTMRRRTRLIMPSSFMVSTTQRSGTAAVPNWPEMTQASRLIPSESDVGSAEWPEPPNYQYKDNETLLLQELRRLDIQAET